MYKGCVLDLGVSFRPWNKLLTMGTKLQTSKIKPERVKFALIPV